MEIGLGLTLLILQCSGSKCPAPLRSDPDDNKKKKVLGPECNQRISFGDESLCGRWTTGNDISMSFWYSNGTEINHTNGSFGIESIKSVDFPVIEQFNGHFAGSYVCKIDRICDDGTISSDQFTVVFEVEQESSSPRAHIECLRGCLPHHDCEKVLKDACRRPDVFAVTVGSAVTFVCNVRYPTCAPYPKAQWKTKRSDTWVDLEITDEITTSMFNDYETLTVNAVSIEHSNNYSCQLENFLGPEITVFEVRVVSGNPTPMFSSTKVTIIIVAVVATLFIFGIGTFIKRKLMKPGGLKPMGTGVDFELRKGETVPLISSDFPSHIPQHYLIAYDLLEGCKMRIGSGCFGEVYTSVVDTDSIPVIRGEINEKRRVALKVGRVENSNTDDETAAATSLLKELKIMMKVEDYRQKYTTNNENGNFHQYVIQLLGCGETPVTKWPFLVIEYAENGDLLTFLKKVLNDIRHKRESGSKLSTSLRLTDADLIKFSYQIAAGMCFLSENRFVHRDMAARNVLVSSDLTMKVSDFGLSKEQNYYISSKGKLPWKWMALESIKEHKFTSSSDVWAFGVTMWEIFTLGNAPYQTKTAYEVKDYLDAGNRLAHPLFASRSIYQIMADCWKSNPKERPSFGHLAEDLEKEFQVCLRSEQPLDVEGHQTK